MWTEPTTYCLDATYAIYTVPFGLIPGYTNLFVDYLQWAARLDRHGRKNLTHLFLTWAEQPACY